MENNKITLTDDVAFFKRLAQFKREGNNHSPDAFNEVARELFGMSVKEAQMLYTKYNRIANGAWYWNDDQVDETIETLSKAQRVLEHSMKLKPDNTYRSIESFLGRERFSDKNRIGVWAKYNGGEPQLFEYWLTSPKNLAMIADMERRDDVEILCIVPWVDSISDLRDCLNEMNDKTTMQVYDGDLFVLLNHGTDDYWNKPSENGVYVCLWGAYRRLLYTVGRGYLTIDNEANVASVEDEDDEYGNVFCLYNGRWNHHLLTMEHQWKRIGNIHVDITMLQERKGGKDVL